MKIAKRASLLRLEGAPVEQLVLEAREEGLEERVVVGVTDRALRGLHPGLLAPLAERNRGVWNLKPIAEYRHHEFDDRVAEGASRLKDDGFTVRAMTGF